MLIQSPAHKPPVFSFVVKKKSDNETNGYFRACGLAETEFIQYVLSRDLLGLPGWGGKSVVVHLDNPCCAA
jgi:hypothetical protein